MRRPILALSTLLLLLTLTPLYSQTERFSLVVHAATALPVGSFDEASTFAIGGRATLLLNLSSAVSLSVGTGYLRFGLTTPSELQGVQFVGDKSLDEESQSFIPLLAGARLRLSESNLVPYVGLELGAYLSNSGDFSHQFMYENGQGGGFITGYSSTEFGISPQAGLTMGISDKLKVDVNVAYHLLFTDGNYGSPLFTSGETAQQSTSFISLGAGVQFGL